MKVILLKDVPKLGKKFEVKNVSDGHALNLLIPQGLVAVATDALVKKMESEKAVLIEKRKKEEAELAKHLEKISEKPLEMVVKANPKGHLFSSIHKAEIARELRVQFGIPVEADFVKLEKPIKEIGDHVVEVSAAGKSAKLKLVLKVA